MLDFKGRIPDSYHFEDRGYVENLLESAKTVFEDLGFGADEDNMLSLGIDVPMLKYGFGGHHLFMNAIDGSSKYSWIYYTKSAEEGEDIWARAHEETHAVCNMGLRNSLEAHLDGPRFNGCGEEFCDAVSLHILSKKGIRLPELLLIPYYNRLRVFSIAIKERETEDFLKQDSLLYFRNLYGHRI